jgi:hypothetical protein
MPMNDERAALQAAINGFRVSRLISLAAKLRLADHLAAGPLPAHDLAQLTGSHDDALYRVMRALAGLGIFEEQPGRIFALTPRAELLRSDAPGSLRVAAETIGEEWVWRPWGVLEHSVATGEPAFDRLYGQSTWEWFGRNQAAGDLFNLHMETITRSDVEPVMAAFDFSRARVIVDIGGGQGTLLAAILRRHRQARGVLLNLPSVIDAIDREGLRDLQGRLDLVAGDFFRSAPKGGELYILKDILHDWPDADAGRILAVCAAAMPPQAKLLIIEHMVCPPNQSCTAKLVDIQMMVRTGGRNRTLEEFHSLLTANGFGELELIRTQTGPDLLAVSPQQS